MCTNTGVDQIKLIRKYLKFKIIEDNITFRGYDTEKNHAYNLVKRVVLHGESHSALIVGPRGSGKTTLVNSILTQLSKEVDLENSTTVVKLNGLIHQDEKVAFKSITAQIGVECVNLESLLRCIGGEGRLRSAVFILEELDMFCHSGRTQMLLYHLFDITHSKRTPLCVIDTDVVVIAISFVQKLPELKELWVHMGTGKHHTYISCNAIATALGVTNRIDLMELLEKRVKSRFSHRHILVFPDTNYVELMVGLLSVPVKERKKGRKKSIVNPENMEADHEHQYDIPQEVLQACKADPKQFQSLDTSFVQDWNAHIRSLAKNDKVVDSIEKFCYYTVNEQIFRNVLFQVVSKVSPGKPYIDPADLCQAVDSTVAPEHRVKLLQSLSVLELSLIIAMMHGMEIFDGQPMNFEMILHRYTKFANANSSTQSVPRPVVSKAFEHLHELEVIVPVRNESSAESTSSRVQKEYKLYTLAVPSEEIKEAVRTYKNLPTEINHWFSNSVF